MEACAEIIQCYNVFEEHFKLIHTPFLNAMPSEYIILIKLSNGRWFSDMGANSSRMSAIRSTVITEYNYISLAFPT